MQLVLLRRYINDSNFSLQASANHYYELSQIFNSMPVIANAVKGLFDVTGRATFALYLDQNRAAIYLNIVGDIKIITALGLPPTNGQLGVLLTVNFGSGVSAHHIGRTISFSSHTYMPNHFMTLVNMHAIQQPCFFPQLQSI